MLNRVVATLTGALAPHFGGRIGGRAANRDADDQPFVSVLDVGTTQAKALVLAWAADDQQPPADEGTPVGGRPSPVVVLGAGRAAHQSQHLRGAAITDLSGAVATCEQALVQAEDMAHVVPRRVVLGVGGELVCARLTAAEAERPRADRGITESELERLSQQCERESVRQVRRHLAWQSGTREPDLRLLQADTTEVRVDGHPVANAVGLHGKRVALSMLHAYAPLVHVSALLSVAEELDLEVVALVVEPYALARGVTHLFPAEHGAICVDTGGATTDVTLVRQGAAVGSVSLPIGGRAFTQGIADDLSIPLEEAEHLKTQYAAGALSGAQARGVRNAVERDVRVWVAALEVALEELAAGTPLPARICLCGGGSSLPEVRRHLAGFAWQRHLPFVRRPALTVLRAADVPDLEDRTGVLREPHHVMPAVVAAEAATRQGPGLLGHSDAELSYGAALA